MSPNNSFARRNITTVQRAVTLLEYTGIVVGRPGVGVFVPPPRLSGTARPAITVRVQHTVRVSRRARPA
jgi:DNA-binding transcriptional regulator YhcF (GntR family)